MPYQEIQALGFPNSPRKLGLYEKPWACISWYGPCTQLVNSNNRVCSEHGNLYTDWLCDGHFTYDFKDLWMAACTSNEQQHSMIFQGLSQSALSQLDKHSEELALQRVSDSVISTHQSIFCFIKTDIPELYKPWTSTSSNHSTLIGAHCLF